MGFMSLRLTEPLITRFGAQNLLPPGLALIAVGLALFALAPVDGNYLQHVLPVTLLLGIGVGSSFPALMTLAMSGATREDAGLASGLINTTAQVGGALGLAVLATVSSTRSDTLIDRGESTASALTSGYHLAFLIGAALVALAIIIAIAVLEPTERAEERAAGGPREEAGEPAYSEAA